MKFENTVIEKSGGSTKLVSPYVNAKTKVTLACANGHTWSVIPSNLVSRGSGVFCSTCAGKHKPGKKTHEEFLLEMQVHHPSITVLGTYSGAAVPISISCSNGHVREVTPTNLLTRSSYSQCKECHPLIPHNKLTLEEAQASIQKYYPYLEVLSYQGSMLPLEVINVECGHTGEYWLPNLVQGKGYACKVCTPHGSSSQENSILAYIKEVYKGWIVERDRSILKGQELDIVLPDLGLAFEINGCYYHSEEKKPKNYHRDKTNALEEFGYQLIHIYDYDINNHIDIVKSRINTLLNKSTRIFARKCEVQEISFPKDFLATNHLQGAGQPTSINLGLYQREQLVAVMTFSYSRYTNKYEYELVRYCSLLNHTIVGGASKLLKHFEREYSPISLVSYAKRDWSKGKLYTQLGFTLSHATAPGYFYIRNNRRINRQAAQKHKLEALFPTIYSKDKSESQILAEAQYLRVNDSGNLVFFKEYN
jgi:very-short-patch-repair endonuclease